MSIFLLFFLVYTDFKGVWIPRWSIDDNDEIFACLDGRFNHIFLQIYALGEAYYPSQYAPSKRQSDRWLRELLKEAHQRGIRVSAWINVFYSWGFAPKTNNHKHPLNQQTHWFVQDQSGRSILDYDTDELKELRIEGYYLSPSNTQVRAYLADIAEEIVKMYDFDGIHLDYIRYPNSQFVYDVSLRSEFMRTYYIDPYDLDTNPQMKTRYSLWGCDDLKSEWREFIHNDLTQFVKELKQRLKRKDPEILISVAVKPNYMSALNEYYQDWLTWLNSGYVDLVCMMSYNRHIEKNLNMIQKVVKDPHRVAVGLGLYLLNPDEIDKQVAMVKKKPFAGVVFFSYDQVKENQEYLRALR